MSSSRLDGKETRAKAAIIGSGNIGIDLMIKIIRSSKTIELAALVGIDPDSEGLAFARRLGIPVTHTGIDGLRAMAEFADITLVFDATSAKSHVRHSEILRNYGKQVIDLTPAAIGPYLVPAVNMDQHLSAPNLNMVSCGGQATIPMVFAVGQITKVHYAEIVSTVASKSAGPGTRANIDEFTQTTARAIETVGGAAKAKAIIVLNPADPPLVMRNTVMCFSDPAAAAEIGTSVQRMVQQVQRYVPGYCLKQKVIFESVQLATPLDTPDGIKSSGMKTSILLEVRGAGHYLPEFAGNLDIMTSAALAAAERMVQPYVKRNIP